MRRVARSLAISAVLALLLAGCGGGDSPSPGADGPHRARAIATAAVPAVRILRIGDPSHRAVALTFDAGGGAANAASILGALRERRVRATFAVTGRWGEEHRDLLLAIAADGHRIMNGTYDGASLARMSAADRRITLSRTETTVYRFTGGRSTRPYVRPPGGDFDAGVLREVADVGYALVVLWSIDAAAWRGTSEDVAARAIAAAAPGAIYRFGIDADADAIARIIDALSADGYAFVTVDARG